LVELIGLISRHLPALMHYRQAKTCMSNTKTIPFRFVKAKKMGSFVSRPFSGLKTFK
jgi:hypothetical protein